MQSGYDDLQLFIAIARAGSLAGAGRELGITGAAISKRLMALEHRLGVRLVQRTTRTLRITPEGERYLQEGKRLVAGLDELEQALRGVATRPTGLLRVNASLGYGRAVVSGLLAEFAAMHPELEVQLHLGDRPLNLVEEGYDIGIRIGELADTRLSARKLRRNRRLICASPAYLRDRGVPGTLADLARHQAVVLHENEQTFGIWHLRNAGHRETVKVRARMSTNDGEVALRWARDGYGLLLRSEWSVEPLLAKGDLQLVLPEWCEPADIYAVFPTRDQLSAKTRACIDFMVDRLAGSTGARPTGGGGSGG